MGVAAALASRFGVAVFGANDLCAQVDAFIADVRARPGDELADLRRGLAAETAGENVIRVIEDALKRNRRPDKEPVTPSFPFFYEESTE